MYPLIPWVGVMALGYTFGALYQKDAAHRKSMLKIMGATAIVLFIVLRAFDIYGDPQKWSQQKNPGIHSPVVSKHNEVSAVVPLFIDDLRSCDSCVGLLRKENPTSKKHFCRPSEGILYNLWSRSVVLLPVAVVYRSRDFGVIALDLWKTCEVAISITCRLVQRSAARGRIQSGCGLSGLDCRCVVTVSAM